MALRFRQIHLEITTRCNLSCSFCPKTERTPPFITDDQFVHRLHAVLPFTDLIYLHLMGEPLLHRRLSFFLEESERAGASIGITTNGTVLHLHTETLLSSALKQLNVSFHAYDSIDSVQRASIALKEISLRSSARINLRLWQSDHDTDLLANPLIGELLDQFSIAPSVVSDHACGTRGSRRISDRIYLHFDRPFDWPGAAPEDRFGTCHALHTHIGILTDGSVVPCCLDNEGRIVLGNIDTQPLEQILGSPRSRSIRGGFTRGEMIEPLCQRCGYAQDRFGSKRQVQRRRESAGI